MRNTSHLKSILELYGNKLPFSVAEYVCKLYLPYVVCNKKVTYSLFSDFVQYREGILYKFSLITSNKDGFNFVKLDGMEILIPSESEEVFMETFSNRLSAGSNLPAYDWYDSDEVSKYCGKVTFSF